MYQARPRRPPVPEQLSTTELRALVTEMILASTATTRNQFGRAMVMLAEHPEAWALLGRRPELATNAVEEVMRLVGTVPGTTRLTLEDLEVNGLPIPAGTFLVVLVAAANREPRASTRSGWRMPELQLDGEPVWRPAVGLNGPNYLPLRWSTST